MAMNASSWISNWFDLNVEDLERQVSNWCNLNARESWLIVVNLDDLKKFLRKNKLNRNNDGRHYFFSPPNMEFVWNEVEDHWGFVYQIKSNKDFDEVWYQIPKTPADSTGVAYVNSEV